MILVPLVLSAVWITVARTVGKDQPPPFLPTTAPGVLALASLALVSAVAVTRAATVVALLSGLGMLALAGYARWRRRDPGVLVVVPIAFGACFVILPLVFE